MDKIDNSEDNTNTIQKVAYFTRSVANHMKKQLQHPVSSAIKSVIDLNPNHSFKALTQVGGYCQLYATVRCVVKLIKTVLYKKFHSNEYESKKTIFFNSCIIPDKDLDFLQDNNKINKYDKSMMESCTNTESILNYALFTTLFLHVRNSRCHVKNTPSVFYNLLSTIVIKYDENFFNIDKLFNIDFMKHNSDQKRLSKYRRFFIQLAIDLIVEFNYILEQTGIKLNYTPIPINTENHTVFFNLPQHIIQNSKFGFYSIFTYHGCNAFWSKFQKIPDFLTNKSCKIYNCNDINQEMGHAVIIKKIGMNISGTPNELTLLNSWGDKWNGNGTFNITKDNYKCYYTNSEFPCEILGFRFISTTNRRKNADEDYELLLLEFLTRASTIDLNKSQIKQYKALILERFHKEEYLNADLDEIQNDGSKIKKGVRRSLRIYEQKHRIFEQKYPNLKKTINKRASQELNYAKNILKPHDTSELQPSIQDVLLDGVKSKTISKHKSLSLSKAQKTKKNKRKIKSNP